MELLTKFYDYYFIVLILQAFCVFHSIRRGTQSKWIWIIVFLPLVGSLVYLFTEVVNRNDVGSAKKGVLSFINPTGRITRLEKQFNFSGTVANRIALADAYLEAGNYTRAIELYEPVLLGNLYDNSTDAIKNLMKAYFCNNRFTDVINIAPRVVNSLNFTKTTANLYFTLALENCGNIAEAESEFKKMNQRFCNYQQRYNYGSFLLRQGRHTEAAAIFNAVINEAEHLSGHEKTAAREWVRLSKQESKKLSAAQAPVY